MNKSVVSLLLKVLLVVFVCVVGQPAAASAQCVTAVTNGPGTFTQAGMAYIYIGKSITNATMCTLTAYNNVLGCAPGGFPPTMTGGTNSGTDVSASAFTSQTNPFCRWNCDCGQVIIDGNDGLPVELMDFSVDDSD